MLSFVFLALAIAGSQQMTAEATNIGLPNDLSHPHIPHIHNPYPNPYNLCPNFFPIFYHYFCHCNFSHCLDPYIESQAEQLALETSYLTLCDIQQFFILLENIVPYLDPQTEVEIISKIVFALQNEVYYGDYIPTQPPTYCHEYTGIDFFNPSSMFNSDNSMAFYKARMQYFYQKILPQMSPQLDEIIQEAFYNNLQGTGYEAYAGQLYNELSMAIRSMLSNMIDMTPNSF